MTAAEWLVPGHPGCPVSVAGEAVETWSSQALIPVLSSPYTLLPIFNGFKIPVPTAQVLL